MKQPKYKIVYVKSDNAPPYDHFASMRLVRRVNPKREPKMYMTARVIVPGACYPHFMVKVPVIMTSIPELPEHVSVEGFIAEKTCDAPLTYTKIEIHPVTVKRIKKK